MIDRNLAIGLSAGLAIVGAVAAVAAGVDWDPRDVAAAEHYRDQERARADRYRAEIAGQPAPETSGSASEAPGGEAVASRQAERDARRAERRAARQEWWDRTLEGVAGRVDPNAAEDWRGRLEGWRDWWRDEAVPAWEDWAARQEERVAEPERFAPSASPDSEGSLPRVVERILEESLAMEEPEVRRRDGSADDWWSEERERMRARREGR